MSQAIEDYLGVEKSRPYPDLIFDEQVVPQSTSEASAAFYPGNVQTALEIVMVVDVEVDIDDTETFVVTYEYGDSWAESITVFSATGSGSQGTQYAVGTELFRFVPPTDVPSMGRLKITTSAGTAGKVSAWPELISR